MKSARTLLLATASAVVALAGLAPAAPIAATRKLPSLLAHAKKPTGEHMYKRMRFELLDPAKFKVVGRPSAASVTLGWPAERPCAFSTFALAIRLAQSDVEAAARAVVPVAYVEGMASWSGPTLDGPVETRRGVWRSWSELRNSELRVRAVAAKPFEDMYGYPAGGLLELRMSSHTTKQAPCSMPNQFRIGPNLVQTVMVASAGL